MNSDRKQEGLLRAIEQLLPASVKKSIEAGGSVKETRVLIAAIESQNEEIVKIILDAGAGPNSPNDNVSAPPLVIAAEKGNNKIISLLLQYGANANIQNGQSLITCASMVNAEGISLLLDAGADPNSKGLMCFSSPLSELADSNIRSIRELSSNPCWYMHAVNIENAIYKGSINKSSAKKDQDNLLGKYRSTVLNMAKLLVSRGANIHGNGYCEDPASIAKEKQFEEMYSYIMLMAKTEWHGDIKNESSVVSLCDVSDFVPEEKEEYLDCYIRCECSDDEDLVQASLFIIKESVYELNGLDSKSVEGRFCGYINLVDNELITIEDFDEVFVSFGAGVLLQFFVIESQVSGNGYGVVLQHVVSEELPESG